MSHPLEDLSKRDIHPSPFIEDRVEEIRQQLTVMHYAAQGILRLDDHSELSDPHVSGALQEGFYGMFQRIMRDLEEVETCTDRLRETGVQPVTERLRAAVEAGVPPFGGAR